MENEMSKLLHEITRASNVGDFGRQTATARVYDDKIMVEMPDQKWIDDGLNLYLKKFTIIDKQAIGYVLWELEDYYEDGETYVWRRIYNILT